MKQIVPPPPDPSGNTSSGQTTAADSAQPIRVGSRWRVPRDAGGGIARVTVGPRPRVPVTGLLTFLAASNPDAISVRVTGRLKALRSPNPCKIGSHLNPATTIGSARPSRDKSVSENSGQMLDTPPKNHRQYIGPVRIKFPIRRPVGAR